MLQYLHHLNLSSFNPPQTSRIWCQSNVMFSHWLKFYY